MIKRSRRRDCWFNGSRDWKERSNKECCCGGHNANNPKSNLHHHGTLVKHLIRLSRRYKEYIRRAA